MQPNIADLYQGNKHSIVEELVTAIEEEIKKCVLANIVPHSNYY
jgi:hypothetical protein